MASDSHNPPDARSREADLPPDDGSGYVTGTAYHRAVAHYEAENARLREALAWYAEKDNWLDGTPGEWVTYPGHPGSYDGFSETEFEHDHGERAREALEAGER
jgi:hypothetical protein